VHGLPIRFLLTPGQASDKTTFPALVDGITLAHDVVADRGYFAFAIIEHIDKMGGIVTAVEEGYPAYLGMIKSLAASLGLTDVAGVTYEYWLANRQVH